MLLQFSHGVHLLISAASWIGAPGQQPGSWRQHRGLRLTTKHQGVRLTRLKCFRSTGLSDASVSPHARLACAARRHLCTRRRQQPGAGGRTAARQRRIPQHRQLLQAISRARMSITRRTPQEACCQVECISCENVLLPTFISASCMRLAQAYAEQHHASKKSASDGTP